MWGATKNQERLGNGSKLSRGDAIILLEVKDEVNRSLSDWLQMTRFLLVIKCGLKSSITSQTQSS